MTLCSSLLIAADNAVTVLGLTEPVLDSTLSSPVTGVVGARKFKEGEFVKRGQVIVELDKKLEELEQQRRQRLTEYLKADLETTRSLFAKPNSSIKKETLDKLQLDYDVSVVDHKMAQEALQRRLIAAPFDGYIVEFFVEVGEACEIERPVVRLVDTRRCNFVGHIEAKAGHGLKLDQPVSLEIEAGITPVMVQGKISYISPVVDPASGLMKVKAAFDNPDAKIRPGVAGKMLLTDTRSADQRK
jgi:RND family efflux transporter MFP subunit